MIRQFGFALALLCAAVFASQAGAVEQLKPQGDYTQQASGMVFPERVAGFQRLRVTRYAADGSDESAGYGLRISKGKAITVTVYVYPSPLPVNAGLEETPVSRARLCAMEFSGMVKEIQKTYESEWHEKASVIDFTPRSGVTYKGLRGSLNISNPSPGAPPGKTIRTEGHLFCHVAGKWSVKYRFSYPRDFEGRFAVDNFIKKLPWTIRGQ